MVKLIAGTAEVMVEAQEAKDLKEMLAQYGIKLEITEEKAG